MSKTKTRPEIHADDVPQIGLPETFLAPSDLGGGVAVAEASTDVGPVTDDPTDDPAAFLPEWLELQSLADELAIHQEDQRRIEDCPSVVRMLRSQRWVFRRDSVVTAIRDHSIPWKRTRLSRERPGVSLEELLPNDLAPMPIMQIVALFGLNTAPICNALKLPDSHHYVKIPNVRRMLRDLVASGVAYWPAAELVRAAIRRRTQPELTPSAPASLGRVVEEQVAALRATSAQVDTEDRARAYVNYIRLLRGSRDPSELADYCDFLGISGFRVDADIRLLDEVDRLEELARAVSQADIDAAHAELLSAIAAKKPRQMYGALPVDERMARHSREMQARRRLTELKSIPSRLAQLKASRPELFQE